MKCNVCGKTISEFATVCPFCHNPVNAITDNETKTTAQNYRATNAKKSVITWLIISCVLFLISNYALKIPFYVSKVPMQISTINLCSAIVEIGCVIYGMFILVSKRILSSTKNRVVIIISAVIIGVLTVIWEILKYERYYGAAAFKLIKGFLFQRILLYSPKGILVALIIIFACYLFTLRQKKVG